MDKISEQFSLFIDWFKNRPGATAVVLSIPGIFAAGGLSYFGYIAFFDFRLFVVVDGSSYLRYTFILGLHITFAILLVNVISKGVTFALFFVITSINLIMKLPEQVLSDYEQYRLSTRRIVCFYIIKGMLILGVFSVFYVGLYSIEFFLYTVFLYMIFGLFVGILNYSLHPTFYKEKIVIVLAAALILHSSVSLGTYRGLYMTQNIEYELNDIKRIVLFETVRDNFLFYDMSHRIKRVYVTTDPNTVSIEEANNKKDSYTIQRSLSEYPGQIHFRYTWLTKSFVNPINRIANWPCIYYTRINIYRSLTEEKKKYICEYNNALVESL